MTKKEKTNNRITENNVVPGKEALSVKEVLGNLKELLKLRTNKELSDVLGVKSNTISTWKKRNSLDYSRLVAFGKQYKLDLNTLFSNNVYEPHLEKDIIAVPRERQYQYVSQHQNVKFLETLPRYRFPFPARDNFRAFQTTCLQPSSAFMGVCYAVGTPMQNVKDLMTGKMYVIVNKEQGILVGIVRKEENNADRIYLTGNTPGLLPDGIGISIGGITEVWKVSSLFYQDFVEE